MRGYGWGEAGEAWAGPQFITKDADTSFVLIMIAEGVLRAVG